MGKVDLNPDNVNKKEKTKYWVGIGYLENMLSDWEQRIGDLFQGLPYAYCIHDKDLDTDGDARKAHVHIIVVFNNTTTYKHALYVFSQLSFPGMAAFNTCKPIINIRGMYNYLIHDTEDCKKKGKHRYHENDEMALELCDKITEMNFTNFSDFFMFVRSNYDMTYFSIVKSYSGLFERLTKGNYQAWQIAKRNLDK